MPDLIVIAGCNGAGKSTFSTSFLPNDLSSFDYDKTYLEHYDSLPDSELRDQFARDRTTKEFESAVEIAIRNEQSFCYETNFDSHPTYWPEVFKEKGYRLNLIFFCLNNRELAEHRVKVRAEFKGHFVNKETINTKWKAGYKNVNLHFKLFDNLLFVDNSVQNEVYTNLLQIQDDEIDLLTSELPEYFERRFPDIYALSKAQ